MCCSVIKICQELPTPTRAFLGQKRMPRAQVPHCNGALCVPVFSPWSVGSLDKNWAARRGRGSHVDLLAVHDEARAPLADGVLVVRHGHDQPDGRALGEDRRALRLEAAL